jgi:hypothetical protein
MSARTPFTAWADPLQGFFSPGSDGQVVEVEHDGSTVSGVALERPSLAGRVWAGVLAVWGGFVGLLPHVLHHVGPLAGAALLAGATGRALFAAVGFVAAIPFLRRLRRRFRTWKAPAIALAVFVAAFSLSSFVIGPTISGDDAPTTGIEDGGHAEHH